MKGFSDSADEVLPNLWISSATFVKDIGWLQTHGITGVVNCADLSTALHPEIYEEAKINYLCLGVTDVAKSKHVLAEKISSALEFIDKQDKAIVNCAAGVSRSATVVLAWLMSRGAMTLRQAFIYLRSKRKFVYPNQGFWEFLIGL